MRDNKTRQEVCRDYYESHKEQCYKNYLKQDISTITRTTAKNLSI